MKKLAGSLILVLAVSTMISCKPNKTASSASSNKNVKCAAFQEPAASPIDAYEYKQTPE